jgi:hypothetical protein
MKFSMSTMLLEGMPFISLAFIMPIRWLSLCKMFVSNGFVQCK